MFADSGDGRDAGALACSLPCCPVPYRYNSPGQTRRSLFSPRTIMQRRSSAAVAPLSALPIPRTREMSALLSAGSAPHTPTKRTEPFPLFSVNPNRYSTDSWNSSNFDGADEIECDWKPEHIRFLGRVSRVTPRLSRRSLTNALLPFVLPSYP